MLTALLGFLSSDEDSEGNWIDTGDGALVTLALLASR